MIKKKFVLITPVKNEEKNLKIVIDSIKKQISKPDLWLITNDGSTDNSRKIIEAETKNYKWIKCLNKKINKEYNWLNYEKVINAGIEHLKKENIKTGFLGILDADISIEKNYFEVLLNYLERNKDAGAASGNIYIKKNNKWVIEREGNKSPRGGARLYNYSILLKSGGFPKTPSPDRISDIKINLKGYRTKLIKDIKAYQHRKTFSRQKKIIFMYNYGISKYILSYNFFHVFFLSLKFAFSKKPFIFSGIIFFIGYIISFLKKRKKIEDYEIINYSKNFWRRLL
jgi:glycosyltransferase involved in cell wall biosynthesis